MAQKRPIWAQRSLAMQDYYDHYWGFPVHDDRFLFEMLCLELFQAGLSWQTIWQRRTAFEAAFANFQVEKIARFTTADVQRLCNDRSIIRNYRKITAVINNAQVVKNIQEQGQTFDHYIWQFVGGHPQRLQLAPDEPLPAQTSLSKQVAQRLEQDHFKFVGPTIVYSFMTAVGLVNARI